MKLEGRNLLQTGIGVLLGIILGVGGLTLTNRARPAPIVIQPPPTFGPTATPGPLRVFVNGEVVAPAVYEFPAGSLVADAIEAAGGFTGEADEDVVNLAFPLADGMQVFVPTVGESAGPPAPIVVAPVGGGGESSSGGTTAGGLVNINTANLDELDTLPGVGPSTAQRIIDYRDANGPFASIEEIMNVSGIGEVTFERLKDLIAVGP